MSSSSSNQIIVQGFIVKTRQSKTATFITLTNGTNNINIYYPNTNIDLYPHMTIQVEGITTNNEIQASKINILGKLENPLLYPLAGKIIPLNTLREVPHLRFRTQTFTNLMKIRSSVIHSIHDFMRERQSYNIDPNILTTSDCEGAGELFKLQDETFFKNPVYLTCSSQLMLEAMIPTLGNVYTLNKSFRAEKSSTNKHLSEFTHVEYEGGYITFNDLLNFTEDFIKYIIKYVLTNNYNNLKTLEELQNKNIIKTLETQQNAKFIRITYKEAKEILKDETITDIGSEQEKLLIKHFENNFVFITNWPASIKAFYMKSSTNNTVDNFDLLSSVGELIGGSMREDNYDTLLQKITERKMDTKPLEWYLDLRKYGTLPHGGFGLGLDRLIMFITQFEHIRDVDPIPVYFENCKY